MLTERAQAAHVSAGQLRWRYIVALSLIAFMTIASQVVVQFLIAGKQHDTHVVNIAGRQRMLSQTIAKTSSYLVHADALDAQSRLTDQLAQSLSQWERAHRGLLLGDTEHGLPGKNSAAIKALFTQIERPYAAVLDAARSILASPGNTAELAKAVRIIQEHEPAFLKGMNDIVLRFDQEARDKITFARWLELGLMAVTLLVLLLEAGFIFAPATRRIEHDMQELANREDDLESLFTVSPTAILLVDSKKLTILHANRKAANFIGLSNTEIVQGTLYDHLDDHYDANRRFLEKLLNDEALNEYEVVRLDARRSAFETLVSVRPITYAGRSAFVLGITNATELKKAQETLEFFATFDEVSGLMSRHIGLLMLNKSMERSKRDGEQTTICFADLDGLMAVNDRFGRAEGDWLIHTVAQVLTGLIEPSDIAIRLGGDEFLLILHHCSPEGGDFLMYRAEERLAEIESEAKKPFHLHISFGTVAYSPDRHATANELIAEADALMSRVKQEKKLRLKRPQGHVHAV
ncbi:diguanylate cyclase domain-containing protein [Rhodoferax sp.]|uniref:diguanylate cyclase domain-containing protein n=1 Tax=Rhodoferax sp. TaxID=50421 RepID=UPI00274F1584|nr:diguanylate cyclase [Rhodoferax sp.]